MSLKTSETSDGFQWTGLGCDVCGFGTIDLEEIEQYDPKKPCPLCGVTMDVVKSYKTIRVARVIHRYRTAKDLDPATKDLRGTARALIDVIEYIAENIEQLSDKDLANQLGYLRYDLKDELSKDIDKFLKAVGLERFVLEEK